MHYKRPTRYRVTASLRQFKNLATGNMSYRCFVPEEGEEVALSDYFLNTKGKVDNDLVHAKITCGGESSPWLCTSPFDPIGWLDTSRPCVAWCLHGDVLTLCFDTVEPIYKYPSDDHKMGDPLSGRTHSCTVYVDYLQNGKLCEDAITATWTSNFDGNVIPTPSSAHLAGERLNISLLVRANEKAVATPNDQYAHDVCLAVASAYSARIPGSSTSVINSVVRYPSGWEPPKAPSGSLLFAEDEMFFDLHLPPGVLCSPEAACALEKARYQAYKEACDQAPRLSDNNISNIIEGIGAITSLIHGEVNVPKSWGDWWLAYRYAYSTTKMDIEEATDYLRRLPTLPSTYKCYGSYTFDYQNTSITMRCRLELFNPVAKTLNKISHDLRTYGLKLGAYQVWDLIPYSFIVDWFLPIGGMLSESETVEYASSYRISAPLYSLTYNRQLGKWQYNVYSRWTGAAPQSIDGLVWYEDSKPSAKTIGKRMVDAAALIMG